jgi:hypothetical protein
MAVQTGRNFEIRTAGSVADCRVWRRPDLSREEGAKCADELCEALSALATSTQVKALVLDLYEAPPAGPLTQKAIERLMRAAEGAGRPVAVIASTARAASSRTTPPLPTCSRPTSNWGLTSTSTSTAGAHCASTAGSTFVAEMNETSTTTRPGRSAKEPGGSSRALTRSSTVTRGSRRSRSASWP